MPFKPALPSCPVCSKLAKVMSEMSFVKGSESLEGNPPAYICGHCERIYDVENDGSVGKAVWEPID